MVWSMDYCLRIQVVVLLLIFSFFLLWQNDIAAIACFYGGSMAIVNTLLQKQHLISSTKECQLTASIILRKGYRCVAERWVIIITMFIVACSILKLLPLPLMIGFIVTELVLLLKWGLTKKYD